MKKPVKNIAASILAQLKNQTEILERPFAETLQYYVMERFLYRLSKTKYASKFILKGGLLLYVWASPCADPQEILICAAMSRITARACLEFLAR